MDGDAWGDGNAKVIGLLLRDATDKLLILASAWHDPLPFTLPEEGGCRWRLRVDSARGLIDPEEEARPGGGSVELEGRTLLLFSCADG
jgi:glycogen operon protein